VVLYYQGVRQGRAEVVDSGEVNKETA
jgi:hypothetical protein